MLGGVFAVYIDIPTKSRYNIAWLNEQAAKRNAVKIRSSPRCREEAAFLSQAYAVSLEIMSRGRQTERGAYY